MIRDVSQEASIMMRDWSHYCIQQRMPERKKDAGDNKISLFTWVWR